MINSQKVANNLKRYMKQNGVSVYRVCMVTGFSQANLGRYLSGNLDFNKMGLGNFVSICQAIEVDPCKIIDDVPINEDAKTAELALELDTLKNANRDLRLELREKSIRQGETLERYRMVINSLKKQIQILTGKRVREGVKTP